MAGADGSIQDANAAALGLLGMKTVDNSNFELLVRSDQVTFLDCIQDAINQGRASLQQEVLLKGTSHRKILVDVLPVRPFNGKDDSGVVIVGRNSTHDGAGEEYLRMKMETDARAAAEALESHLRGMDTAKRAQAMKMLRNIMAAWLRGSVRGYLFSWHTKWQNFRDGSGAGFRAQKGAVMLLQKIMDSWLAGSLRGFYFTWRTKFQRDKAMRDLEGLGDELRGKVTAALSSVAFAMLLTPRTMNRPPSSLKGRRGSRNCSLRN